MRKETREEKRRDLSMQLKSCGNGSRHREAQEPIIVYLLLVVLDPANCPWFQLIGPWTLTWLRRKYMGMRRRVVEVCGHRGEREPWWLGLAVAAAWSRGTGAREVALEAWQR